ncbi:Quercetin 2,3-dioxygenase [Gemmata sp. SH-PL17]|uniref:pirin family protein n=1 Tax=Gemmata sp. SH-PL17 TaxID=1630693 RepID=UPI0004AF4817|nr:pirin family protein [Gemmata sp. SH-PL17]AMV23706.1 Quercetin 2,3-dioxygenase [Gemmata sp. SH-PL17]
MLTIRKGTDRGVTKYGGWLDSRHTFSFGEYQDHKHHQFRTLRVINDDRVAAGGGFPTHPHRDMEILTCVLSGALEHADSMGNGEVIRAGEWQAMTAGTGITHSEFNPSDEAPVHLLQIWLFPDKRGHKPGYQQKVFTDADKGGKWALVASPTGENGSLVIHQDAQVYQTKLAPGDAVRHELKAGRAAFVHVATGAATVNGTKLVAGDAVAVEDEKELTVSGDGEVLLFDLA